MLTISFSIVLISLTLSQSQRVSERKCTEYKNLIKSDTSYGGIFSLGLPTSQKQIYNCGDVGLSGLTTEGLKIKPGEFPHAAAIGWKSTDYTVEFKCGGSLISERYVLTAAHCATDDDLGNPMLVRFGAQNLRNDYYRAVDVDIKRFIKHPSYDSSTNTHDIALIELRKDVPFNLTTIRPGCLQQTEFDGKRVMAIGWGRTNTFGPSNFDILFIVNLPVNQIDVCENELDHDDLNSSRQICVGGEFGKDTCQGDSGGPIQVAHSDAACVYDIIGLSSFGSAACGRKAPAVYTKVSAYLDWIEQTAWPEPRRTDKRPVNTQPVWN